MLIAFLHFLFYHIVYESGKIVAQLAESAYIKKSIFVKF